MKTTITSNKGGQGKTTISTLLAVITATREKEKAEKGKQASTIYCCDLDKTQQNFRDNLSGYEDLKDIIKFVDGISDIPEDALGIIDTPSELGKNTIEAIRMADILIVPIIPAKHAVQGVKRIAAIRGSKTDLRIVANDWDGSAAQLEAEEELINDGFVIRSKLRKYKRLTYNLDAQMDWYTGFTNAIIKTITNVLRSLITG